MRGSGGGIAAMKNKVSSQAVQAMAWLSFGLAIIGGAAVTTTWVSTWLVDVFGWLGTWGQVAAAVALVVGVLILLRDLLMDWIPNWPALIVVAAAPTVARACSGGLSSWVTTHAQMALDWFNGHLGGWMPGGATGWVAAACAFAGAAVLAQRTVPKSYGGR